MFSKKRVLSIALSMILAVSVFAGCASETNENTDSAVSADTTTAAPVAEATGTSAETESGEWDGEITNIKVLLFDVRGVGENAEPIMEKVNAITEKTIGVHADVLWVSTAEYGTTASLSISSGEQLDVMSVVPIPPMTFNSLIANQQLLDITDYMEEEAQETLELLGGYADGMSVGGRIYGIPSFRNYAASVYIIMRQDVLEDLGMVDSFKNAKSWSEIDEIYAAVKEQTSLAPLGTSRAYANTITGKDSFSDGQVYDTLGDSWYLIYTDNDGNISLTLDNPDYLEMLEAQQEYWNKGWVYKDVLTTDEAADTLIKAGVVFSNIIHSELGVEAAKMEATGYPIVANEVQQKMVASGDVNKFGVAVPVTAQEPEAAVRWINAVWTNPEIENLMVWGIEGEDYVVADGEADFPEGSDGNVKFHSANFVYGNLFNLLPWKGNGADYNTIISDYLMSAPISPYMGFTADNSAMTNTITAIDSVYQKYGKSVLYGAAGMEEIEKYKAELKTAGIDEYVASLQEQLSAWKAENN